MKNDDFQSLAAMSLEDLRKQLVSARRDLVEVRMNARVGQEKNTARVNSFRKAVARLQTAIRQKELLEL